MHYPMMTQKHKRIEHLSRKASNQHSAEADKAVGLDELVEIDAKQFSDDAEVASKGKVLCHLDNIVLFLRILCIKRQPPAERSIEATHPFA